MSDLSQMIARMKSEIEDIERLRTEHKMLREALQPFAEAWLERETWEAQINIDDLRAAHKAYGSCHDWSN
jgi:hypothetical protein